MTVLERLRERFWFLPAVLCVVAAAPTQILVALDESIDDRHPGDLERYPVSPRVVLRAATRQDLRSQFGARASPPCDVIVHPH